MPDTDDESPLNSEETKAKLRQIRSDYTRARNILTELETYYASFDEARKQLDDEKDGLNANLGWSQTKKSEIDEIVAQANMKVTELEAVTTSVASLSNQVQAQYDTFTTLAAKINDPTTGIQAMLALATTLKDNIAALVEAAEVNRASSTEALTDIQEKADEVEEAYDAFVVLRKQVDDPETGVAAQLAEIKQYAKDALTAKASAESDLMSITSMKEAAVEHTEAARISKGEIDDLKTESESLTNDIRNTLNKTSAYSLSKEIQTQRKKLDRSVFWWGFAVGVTAFLFAWALGLIFYTLFLDPSTTGTIKPASGPGVLLTILSKALFTSPFIFALYFTTSNFSRTRETRDKYVAKEIAAKNLQAYVKLLRDEFPENSKERLNFALHNMQVIYDDPTPSKKRSYNFGINKVFQFGLEEEDTQHLKDKLIQGAEDIMDDKTDKET
jgi:hypothetical protein